MALGLSLILSIMRILQFAHGEVYMLGAYAVYFFSVILGLNFYIALFITIILSGLFGLLLERVLFRPLKGEFLGSMIVALGLSIMLQAIVSVYFGVSQKSVPSFAPGSVNLAISMIGNDRIIAVVISILMTLGLFFFLKRTRYGQALTASSQLPEAAILIGISPNRMSALTMVIGGVLAAIGGALMGAILIMNPFMGSTALMKGLVIIVLGGMGSIWGAVIGGIILGMVDGVALVVFGPVAASIAPLLLVMLVLIVKPKGLFGHES
jgi:branched-chain amino acid transport system permease protein